MAIHLPAGHKKLPGPTNGTGSRLLGFRLRVLFGPLAAGGSFAGRLATASGFVGCTGAAGGAFGRGLTATPGFTAIAGATFSRSLAAAGGFTLVGARLAAAGVLTAT